MATKTYNYVRVGWLKPKALTGPHVISNIKMPKARIVFGWVTFLAFDCWCTLPPIYGTPKSYWKWPGEPDIFHTPCEILGACPWGKHIGASHIACIHSRCSPLKQGNSFGSPLILILPVSRLHIDLDQLGHEESTRQWQHRSRPNHVRASSFIC